MTDAKQDAIEELLNDLDARLGAAIGSLNGLISEWMPGSNESSRLIGKRQGFEVVKDWLRSYRTPSEPKSRPLADVFESTAKDWLDSYRHSIRDRDPATAFDSATAAVPELDVVRELLRWQAEKTASAEYDARDVLYAWGLSVEAADWVMATEERRA